MNWQREFEARLADDPRLERKASRTASGLGFFLMGKEVANFTAPASIDIRMSAAGIYALGALTAEESVLAVSKDSIQLRLASDEDLAFAQKILARLFKEKPNDKRPEGKVTNRSSGKSKAAKAFGDAKALKSLMNFDPKND